jgi:hypothetical protein
MKSLSNSHSKSTAKPKSVPLTEDQIDIYTAKFATGYMAEYIEIYPNYAEFEIDIEEIFEDAYQLARNLVLINSELAGYANAFDHAFVRGQENARFDAVLDVQPVEKDRTILPYSVI